MSEFVKPFAEWCAAAAELVGIAIIVVLAAYSLLYGAVRLIQRRQTTSGIFTETRHRLGRGILLGLEFLVAGDIIHTVAVELSYQTVTVLAIIVAIRTFLSFTLEVELTGHWPWQKRQAQSS